MSNPHSSETIWDSAWHACTQPPPPSLTEVLAAYSKKGDGDKEMLIAILNAKSREDQRIAEVASLHSTILQVQVQARANTVGHPSHIIGLPSPSNQHYSSPSPSHQSQSPKSSSMSTTTLPAYSLPRPTLPSIHHIHSPNYSSYEATQSYPRRDHHATHNLEARPTSQRSRKRTRTSSASSSSSRLSSEKGPNGVDYPETHTEASPRSRRKSDEPVEDSSSHFPLRRDASSSQHRSFPLQTSSERTTSTHQAG